MAYPHGYAAGNLDPLLCGQILVSLVPEPLVFLLEGQLESMTDAASVMRRG